MGFTNYDPYIWHVQHRGSLYEETGDLTAAKRQFDRALQLASDAGDLENQLFTHSVYTALAYYTGDGISGMEHARRALELVQKVGSSSTEMALLVSTALVHLVNGAYDAAFEAQEEALRICRVTGVGRVWLPRLLAQHSEVHLARGDSDRALALAEEALSTSRRCGTLIYDPVALVARAGARLEVMGPTARDAIEGDLREALAIVEHIGAKVLVPSIVEARAELAKHSGDTGGQENALREAQRLYTAMGAAGHAARLQRPLDER